MLNNARSKSIQYNYTDDISGEIWKPIEDFSGYDISNLGRIRTYWTRGRNSKLSNQPQRLMSLKINPRGYHIVSLKRNCGSRSMQNVYALVAMAFLGPRPEGLEICHNDGRPQNSIASNLRYDTRSSNQKDAVKAGKHKQNPRKNWENYKRELGVNILSIILATG